ncbi:MAG TPA: hypothetical protein VNY73_08580 [Bacteroidia bacterium]|jgi:hypothetical protein|nr:hypothetical protein [Bacteroidia bacterium]
MIRKGKIILFIVLILCLGFFREYIFVGINGVLYNKYYNPGFYDIHIINPSLRFLNAFSYQTLYVAKWLITPVFVCLFWLLQKKFLTFIFHEKKTTYWLSMLYLSLLLLAGISFFTGWLSGHLNEGYRFSRIFMGLIESPVPCMILIPLTYFYKNINIQP